MDIGNNQIYTFYDELHRFNVKSILRWNYLIILFYKYNFEINHVVKHLKI